MRRVRHSGPSVPIAPTPQIGPRDPGRPGRRPGSPNVGMPHGYLNFPGLCRIAPQALAEICAEQLAEICAEQKATLVRPAADLADSEGARGRPSYSGAVRRRGSPLTATSHDARQSPTVPYPVGRRTDAHHARR